MKNIILLLILLTIPVVSFAQYNNDTACDAIMIISDNAYLYKTPQTIPNSIADTLLVKLPKGLLLSTLSFKYNYFKVNVNGEIGYIFCLQATTPKRIREIQEKLQFKELIQITNKNVEQTNTQNNKINQEMENQILNYNIWFLLNN